MAAHSSAVIDSSVDSQMRKLTIVSSLISKYGN